MLYEVITLRTFLCMDAYQIQGRFGHSGNSNKYVGALGYGVPDASVIQASRNLE